MANTVYYAVGCHQGKVRDKNQDNFWTNGSFLESDNKGLRRIICGEISLADCPAFCVFDGVGGECSGEIASYLAAKNFDECYGKWDKKNPEKFLFNSCMQMSKCILDFSRDNCNGIMGTTVASVLFSKKETTICNVGDSPVFVHNLEGLEKISTDHVAYAPEGMKPPLTQSLGVPEDRITLEPSIFNVPVDEEDMFLLCSDGLTDMVELDVICEILDSRISLKRKVKKLIKKALRNGGKDNITVILCKLS